MSTKEDSIIKTLRNDILFAKNVISCEDSRKLYFSSPTDFTRRRKLPYPTVLALLMRNDKRNLSSTVDSFFIDRLWADRQILDLKDIAPTGSAFCQQRAKIRPVLFSDWLKVIADNFYRDVECDLWNGMILASFDGSRIKVPATEDLVKQYGCNGNNNPDEKPLAMICLLYDILNGIVIDAAKGTARTAEQRLAYSILARTSEKRHKVLYLCDRAYTSFRLMNTIMLENNFFVIRAACSRTRTIKEFYNSGKNDDIIEIKCSAQSHKEMIASGFKLPSEAIIKVRAIRYQLPNGETEILLTNLPADKFTAETVGNLYPLRWGIETAIGFIKNEEQMEISSGLTDICFSQSFYIALILYSICSIISILDEEKMAGYNKIEGHRHKYKINHNNCWTELQRLLPVCFMAPLKLSGIVLELADLFFRHLIPIRPHRHYKRLFRGNGKYITFLTYKRAI